ncbi:hypothetical protein COY07_00815 [Candidatus Peregrinibacteria bacterium CG_4_10_14_0_2_um_filter_43_11]|nr:MAG: hypothetical protein COY07_00815 [Candidatus Peregrinibacteria bacterium CG_4_10_14_0_2_um_filter_43_11]
MKKIILLAIGIIFVVLLAQIPLYSKSDLPYPQIQEEDDRPPVCHQSFLNEMHLMRKAWEGNLETLIEQEKPASKMVDEAFESVRTYRCWLDYLCSMVRYSGNASPVSTSSGVSKANIGVIPGCADPEDLEIPGTKLRYLSQCHVPDSQSKIAPINANYNACLTYLSLEFADPKSDNKDSAFKEALKYTQNRSHAFITLEKVLQGTHARQKATALESKLTTILNKMHAMEGAAETLKNFIQQLDDRLPCYIKECT